MFQVGGAIFATYMNIMNELDVEDDNSLHLLQVGSHHTELQVHLVVVLGYDHTQESEVGHNTLSYNLYINHHFDPPYPSTPRW